MGIGWSDDQKDMGGEGNQCTAIAGFMMRKMTNKLDHQYLIFDLNSTTYVETYAITTKRINLAPRITLHTPLPNFVTFSTNL